MNNNSKGISTGTAIIITVLILLFIGWLFSLFEPKCAVSGCKNKTAYGSKYCYLHEMSDRYYGNPDYEAVYDQSKEKQKSSGSNNSNYSSSSSSSSSNSGSSGSSSSNSGYSGSTSSKNSGSSSKSYGNRSSTKKSSVSGSSANGYDDGYDDVYSNGEPDWDRYDEDNDYAMGADDAMEDYYEYGEDW